MKCNKYLCIFWYQKVCHNFFLFDISYVWANAVNYEITQPLQFTMILKILNNGRKNWVRNIQVIYCTTRCIIPKYSKLKNIDNVQLTKYFMEDQYIYTKMLVLENTSVMSYLLRQNFVQYCVCKDVYTDIYLLPLRPILIILILKMLEYWNVIPYSPPT